MTPATLFRDSGAGAAVRSRQLMIIVSVVQLSNNLKNAMV